MTKEQLTDLTAKYLDGTATARERKLIEQWYYSFEDRELVVELPAGESEYELESRMKARIDELNAQESRRKRIFMQVKPYRMVAAVFLVLTATLLSVFFSGRQVYNAQQQPRFVVLKDGSRVWLNSATKLVYTDFPFMGERRLSLTGEAYFDVASDPDKPFIIQSGNMVTQVLGTAFNIKAYPDEPFAITVTKGKVKLEDKKTKTVTFLTPNKQVKYASQQPPVLVAVKADVAYSWTKGQLEFYDQSFEEIARTINRKYNVNIVFANKSLEQCMITATFEKESPVSRVIELLCKINNATYTFSADSSTITLEGKGCQ
ncbi:FecR family protein [Chitinophaga sp. CF418]|uniref:FecR family protein n=1 Tax=Chitinophaga sp. CF418 TaxID=1855287 RepID=UPI0009196119|nr:FecR domain-containing protein [Chitinophaga sp. CF418]SHN38774.1 FecR family protein [Chitinophaga sp. CF418]